MENLKIGEGLLKLNLLVRLMKESSSYPTLLKNWKSFGWDLGVNETEILALSNQLGNGTKQLPDIPYELISFWMANEGDKATMKALCDALSRCHLKHISDLLHQKYWLDATKSLRIKLQDNVVILEDILDENTSEETYQLIYHELQKNAYTQPIQLLKDSVCPTDEIHYYIPRTLSSKNQIDEKIFREGPKDHLFLIKGITKNELAKLSGFQPVEVSGNQFERITARFMILERDEDFQRICQKSINPVHLIDCQNGSYFWIKSSNGKGTIKIQKFMKETKNNFGEEELVGSIVSNRVVSVADSPGMGKSFLLYNLALACKRNSNSIAILISLDEFTKQEQLIDIDSSYSALNAIAEFACASKVAKSILEVMMNSTSYQFSLFLDGFDEVAQSNQNKLNQFLKNLNRQKNFRVFVTTRPHLCLRLEEVLNVLSYEILPFNESNQIEFLSKYWVDKHNAECGALLENYARECLKSLSQRMTDQEKQIAGIPLQCKMLAEVYAEDAERASKVETESTKVIKISCLFDMYKSLVDLKFKRLSKKTEDLKSKYINAHIFEALKLLFPHWTEKFAPLLEGFDQIDESALFAIGLIEKSRYSDGLRFLHRTFAEYLLTEFLVKNRKSECIAMVFGEIIGGKGIYNIYENCISPDEYLCICRFPAMAYFLNMHLKDQTLITPMNELVLDYSRHRNEIDLENLCKSIVVCGTRDLEILFELSTKLFQSLIGLNAYDPEVITCLRDKYFKLLPHFTVKNCKNVTLVKSVIDFTKITFGVDLSYHAYTFNNDDDHGKSPWVPECTPLHMAVHCGNYNLVSHLVQEYGDGMKNFKHLYNLCTKYSFYDSDSLIQDKLSIIDLLAYKEYGLEGLKNDKDTPLLEYHVHLKLLDRLVDIGADINAHSIERYGTVLHTSGNSENWKELIPWASLRGFNKINSTNEIGWTPLMQAVESNDVLDEETLEVFHKAGANFQAVGTCKTSVLLLAMKTQSVSVIMRIIEYGADVNHKNDDGKHAAHFLLCNFLLSIHDSSGVMDKLDLLISKGFRLLNQADSRGLAPFGLAMGNIRFLDNPRLLELFRSSGVDFNEEFTFSIYGEKGNALLRTAGRISYGSVAIIIEGGADVNFEDKKYRNVAHALIQNASRRWGIMTEELLKTFRLIVSKGFYKINYSDQDGLTPLHYLLDHKNLDLKVIEYFREIGADFNTRDVFGWSVISKALKTNQNVAVIEALLKYGADLYNRDSYLDGQSLLHFFVSNSSLHDSHIKLLVSNLHVDINLVDGEGCTPLHYIFLKGSSKSCELLKLFHENSADFNATDKYGNSVLFHALSSRHNQVHVLEKLIEWCADVNHVNKDNRNAAHIAIQNTISADEVLRIVKLLMKSKFTKIDERDKNGITPLLLSVKRDIFSEELLKYFLENGANINAADESGWSVFFIALETQGFWSTECELLMKHGADVTHLTSQKQNALHVAAMSGYASKVALVHNTGKFDSNSVDEHGRTMLHYFPLQNAIFHDLGEDLHLFRFLHAKGANFNAIDKHGESVLCAAIQGNQHQIIIRNLVKYGADLKYLNSRKQNALHIAAYFKNHSALEFLIDKFDIDVVDDDGATPLHYLFLNEEHFGRNNRQLDSDLLELFHKNGADFNAKDKNSSVLFYAICSGQNSPIISKIVEYGGDPYYVSTQNCNALHVAALCANASALKFLVNKFSGFHYDAVDELGNTPLHKAFCFYWKNYREVVELLLKCRAKFDIKNKKRQIPLVSWILNRINPFSTILELEDLLPISIEIASKALTALIQRPTVFQEELSDFSDRNKSRAFTKFFAFLITKGATVLKKDGSQIEWEKVSNESLSIFDQIITGNLLLEIYISRSFSEFETSREMLDFSSFVNEAKVPIHILLEALLTSKQYEIFQTLCHALNELVL